MVLLWCAVSGKLGPQAIAHVDLFTQLSSNKSCSTVQSVFSNSPRWARGLKVDY